MSNINNTTQSATANSAPARSAARIGTNRSTSAAANLAPIAALTAPAVWNENTINLLIN